MIRMCFINWFMGQFCFFSRFALIQLLISKRLKTTLIICYYLSLAVRRSYVMVGVPTGSRSWTTGSLSNNTRIGTISWHYTFKGHLLHLTSNQRATGHHVQLCCSSWVETSISNELLPHPPLHIPETGCSVRWSSTVFMGCAMVTTVSGVLQRPRGGSLSK